MGYFVFDKILRTIFDDRLIVRVMLFAGAIVFFIENEIQRPMEVNFDVAVEISYFYLFEDMWSILL
jgi:hypothetical protein